MFSNTYELQYYANRQVYLFSLLFTVFMVQTCTRKKGAQYTKKRLFPNFGHFYENYVPLNLSSSSVIPKNLLPFPVLVHHSVSAAPVSSRKSYSLWKNQCQNRGCAIEEGERVPHIITVRDAPSKLIRQKVNEHLMQASLEMATAFITSQFAILPNRTLARHSVEKTEICYHLKKLRENNC